MPVIMYDPPFRTDPRVVCRRVACGGGIGLALVFIIIFIVLLFRWPYNSYQPVWQRSDGDCEDDFA